MYQEIIRQIKKQLLQITNVPNPSLNIIRKQFDDLYLKYLSNNILDKTPVELPDCKAHWLKTTQLINSRKVILFLHGGAFIMGSTAGHLDFLNRLAKICSIPILSVDYRLAPEHPFPAALEDCQAAYDYLLEQGYLPQNIALVGFTAGGMLALSLLVQLKEKNLLPKTCACISPPTDFSFQYLQSNSLRINDWVDENSLVAIKESYLSNQYDLTLPTISPIHADLSNFPPLLIQVGSDELLRGDIEYFVDIAKMVGVPVEFSIWEDMIHCWPAFAKILPPAQQSIEELGYYSKAQSYCNET
jgi:epsilon-lactone hydrolase